MIKILNPTRLTRQPLFEKLINYLDQQDNVILREIKREFAGFPNLDRFMEECIGRISAIISKSRFWRN